MIKMKRLLALLLSFMFVLCACQAEEPEIVPEYSTDKTGVDLDGYKLKWGFAKSGADSDENVFGYIPGTSFADSALRWLQNLSAPFAAPYLCGYYALSAFGLDCFNGGPLP